MFDFVENNFDSLLRHVEQYYDFKQILVKVCSRASYARDQIASKIRASCEQDSIISRADREHIVCSRSRSDREQMYIWFWAPLYLQANLPHVAFTCW